MDDLTNRYPRLNAVDYNEASSYEEWSRLHQEIFSGLNTEISKLRDDWSSVISKRSRRSKTISKSSGETSNSSLYRKTEMLVKVARLGTELKFHEIEKGKDSWLKKAWR